MSNYSNNEYGSVPFDSRAAEVISEEKSPTPLYGNFSPDLKEAGTSPILGETLGAVREAGTAGHLGGSEVVYLREDTSVPQAHRVRQ